MTSKDTTNIKEIIEYFQSIKNDEEIDPQLLKLYKNSLKEDTKDPDLIIGTVGTTGTAGNPFNNIIGNVTYGFFDNTLGNSPGDN